MKIHLLICLILLSLAGYSQSSPQHEAEKWQLGFSFSPEYSYRSLHGDNPVIEMRDSLEKARFGFSTGIVVKNVINPRWSITGGLMYSDKGEKTIKSNLYSIDPRPGDPVSSQTTWRYHYLDIPLKARYYLLDGKISVFISAGVAVNIFLQETKTVKLWYSDNSTEIRHNAIDDSSLRPLSLTGIAGAGIEYLLTSKLTLSLEPVFRHSLIPVNDGGIRQCQFSAGINTGIFLML